MSYPAIHRFVDKVRGIAPNARDFTMSVADAKALHSEITKLLLSLETSKESNQTESQEITKVEIKGGDF
jgi:hypothetical protein